MNKYKYLEILMIKSTLEKNKTKKRHVEFLTVERGILFLNRMVRDSVTEKFTLS